MMLARNSISRWFLRILLLQLLAAFKVYGDVIYLNDGNILLVEKAWEEGDEVKYRTGKEIHSLPKSSVQSIGQEKPISPPSVQRWSIPVGQGSQSEMSSQVSAPQIPASPGTTISQEALVRLRDNLKADPSDSMAKLELMQALNSIASLQVAQGDLEAARSSLEEALKLDRNHPALLSNLATVYWRLGSYSKAEDALLACLQVDRTNQWVHYLLGETYYKQDKISLAMSQWKEALQLGPNDAIAKRLEQARRELGVHDELSALKSMHFYLRYDSKTSSSALGEQILATLEDLYHRLSSELTSHAPETVAVILYPDQAYFDITRAPAWTGGVYDGKIRIPTKGLYSVTPELKAALAHELTHCFMTSLPGRGSPTWFLEGVAQVQEGRTAANHKRALAQLQQANRLIPLKSLRNSFVGLQPGMVELAYSEGLSAVEYLIARFGRSAVRDLLDLMARNYNFENAFNKTLQRSSSDFEMEWQRTLTQ